MWVGPSLSRRRRRPARSRARRRASRARRRGRPRDSRVSSRGMSTFSSRTIATICASAGRARSATVRSPSMAGASASRVTSTSVAPERSSSMRRTTEPTVTASSTSAVSSWGVDTLTSTPQDSLNSQAFFALLTREMTRGTANSCLDSQLMTRLSSSSPVAATTTSAVRSPARWSDETSQASAARTSTPGQVAREARRRGRGRPRGSGRCGRCPGGPRRWPCRRCRRRR